MIQIALALSYVILCVFVGLLGRNTRIGFWGSLVLSFVATPLIVGLGITLFSSPRLPKKEKR